MSYCKFTSSSSKTPFHFLPSSNQPNRTLITQDISFKFQVTKSRISVGSRSGPRRRSRISAFYAPAAETEESLYELLGIDESVTTLSDIKKAYKKMARKYHPDVSPPDRVDENTKKFILVKEAYETLSNPQMRAVYDRDLASGSGFGFSSRSQYERREETGEWKMRWNVQLDELKRRSMNPTRGKMSWGARMRAKRS